MKITVILSLAALRRRLRQPAPCGAAAPPPRPIPDASLGLSKGSVFEVPIAAGR